MRVCNNFPGGGFDSENSRAKSINNELLRALQLDVLKAFGRFKGAVHNIYTIIICLKAATTRRGAR